jgi:hypothetical protein
LELNMNPKFVRNFAVMAVAALSGIAGSAMFSPKSGQAPIHSPTPAITANPLIGEWEFVESYQSQKEVPRELLPKLRIRFTERLFMSSPALGEQCNTDFREFSEAIEKGLNKRVEMVFVVDEVGWTMPYQIDPTKAPQEIDLLQTRDGIEERVKGIYEIAGDSAVLAFGERRRPSDFTTPVEKRGVVYRLKRKCN